MAEQYIKTINLFKAKTVVPSDNALSDAIDLRDYARVGDFSISYTIGKAGGVATCGSAKISYLGSPYYEGTYISPTGGTCGTVGDEGGSDFLSITPPVMPFMKVKVAIGSSGTALVTADLHVR